MRKIFVLCLGLTASCAPSLRDQQGAYNDADTALLACQAQNLPTFSAKVACADAGKIAAFKAHKFPYMDLAKASSRQNEIIAQQVDKGALTAKAGAEMIMNNEAQMMQQANARNADDARRRAIVAGALMQAGQSMQQPVSPTVRCTANTYNGTTYTNCQ